MRLPQYCSRGSNIAHCHGRGSLRAYCRAGPCLEKFSQDGHFECFSRRCAHRCVLAGRRKFCWTHTQCPTPERWHHLVINKFCSHFYGLFDGGPKGVCSTSFPPPLADALLPPPRARVPPGRYVYFLSFCRARGLARRTKQQVLFQLSRGRIMHRGRRHFPSLANATRTAALHRVFHPSTLRCPRSRHSHAAPLPPAPA